MYQYHETYNKIFLNNPKMFTIIMILLFLFFTIVFIRKHNSNVYFLDRIQTDQLKGIAILVIIVGHFAWHAIDNMDKLAIFSHWGYICVGIFLTLSAFGLHRSSIKYGFNNFFFKRIKRVYLPYVIVTIVWFIFDFCLLGKSYKIEAYTAMALGINDFGLGNIDGNMWYITYLFFWYIVFFIIFKMFIQLESKIKLTLCFIISFVILYLSSKIITPNTWGINAFDFPIGLFISVYLEKITMYLKNTKKLNLIFIVVICSIGYLVSKFIKVKTSVLFLSYLFNSLSSVFLGISIIVIIYIITTCNIYSKFLIFAGSISFELYLLHGPLMYRYDFIIWRGNPIITFPIYMIFIILIAYLFKKLIKYIEGFLPV